MAPAKVDLNRVTMDNASQIAYRQGVLRLCGCGIEGGDANYLIATLTNRGTPSALEAAAAIHWGTALHVDTTHLEPDLRDEILSALSYQVPTGLLPLRAVLVQEAAACRAREGLA